jgi:hypothetical protein
MQAIVKVLMTKAVVTQTLLFLLLVLVPHSLSSHHIIIRISVFNRTKDVNCTDERST